MSKWSKRGNNMWPKIIEIINYWSGLLERKQTGQGKPRQNVNYNTLIKAVKDPLVPVKLQFVEDIARTLNSFLMVFQLNRPMALILADNIEKWVIESKNMFVVD